MSYCWYDAGEAPRCGVETVHLHGCRGPDCVASHNEYHNDRRAKRRAISLANAGNESGGCLYVLGVAEVCGTMGIYTSGCKGDDCRAAGTEYARERNARKRKS